MVQLVTPDNQQKFYGGVSPRDVPYFRMREAAKAIDGMPESTLRHWAQDGAFKPARCDRPITLSFNNLVEARVLRTLRVRHGIPMNKIREAITYAESALGIDALLLRSELRFDGAQNLLIEEFGKLTDLNPSSQLKLRYLLSQTLSRVEFDNEAFAQRFYPRFSGAEDKVVYIDPRLRFGQAVVSDRAISTSVIHDRYNVGEHINDLAEDYRIDRSEVEQAIFYEAAA